MNFAAKTGGSVRVELQDADGQTIEPFSAANAALTGDSLSKAVTWGDQTDLRQLTGKAVRIRFVLKDAQLYSFRFE